MCFSNDARHAIPREGGYLFNVDAVDLGRLSHISFAYKDHENNRSQCFVSRFYCSLILLIIRWGMDNSKFEHKSSGFHQFQCRFYPTTVGVYS